MASGMPGVKRRIQKTIYVTSQVSIIFPVTCPFPYSHVRLLLSDGYAFTLSLSLALPPVQRLSSLSYLLCCSHAVESCVDP